MITDRAEVKKGDILIYNTGYHKYFNGAPEEDEERYFLRHPGGDREFAEWLVEMEFAWTGFDCGSGDNPMNTSIRYKRPDALKQYEKQIGKDVNEVFPERGPVRDAQGAVPAAASPTSRTSAATSRRRAASAA